MQYLIHLYCWMPVQCSQEEGAEEDLRSASCLFWEPLFCTTLWSFPDSSWNKYSDLVSPGSNVVYMLWGLLVMQRSINRDCQEACLKEHLSFTGIAGGYDGSKSLICGKTTLMSALSGFSCREIMETWSNAGSQTILFVLCDLLDLCFFSAAASPIYEATSFILFQPRFHRN